MSPLKEAEKLVHSDRAKQYGNPHESWSCIAKMWSAMLTRKTGVEITIRPEFACLMMAALKLAREANEHKEDNLVDACGYLECSSMCLDHEQRKDSE